jgi:hypothetical protein
MRTDKHAKLIAPVRQIVELLVNKNYDEIARMTNENRLSSAELRQAVADYGRKLTTPPDSAWDQLDVIEVRDRDQPTYSVRFDLWADGKRSDLSVEITLEEMSSDGKFRVELDDLHVL